MNVNCILLDIAEVNICKFYQLIFLLTGVSSSSLSSLSSLARHLFGLCWYRQLRIPFLMLMKSWWGGYTIWSTSSPHFTNCSNIPSKSTLDAQLLMSCRLVNKVNQLHGFPTFFINSTLLFSFCRSHLLCLKAEPGSFL